MPDQSEVAQALVTLISAAMYPNGTTLPSVTGDTISVRAGWPIEIELGAWLANGGVAISVFPMSGDKILSVLMGDDWATTGAATITQELRRQVKSFKVTVWAPTWQQRDAVGSCVDLLLAGLSRIPFVDGSVGLVRFVTSFNVDGQQKAAIYRQDLTYSVEYSTTQNLPAVAIATAIINVTNGTTATPIT